MGIGSRAGIFFISILALFALASSVSGLSLVPESTSITSCICETNLVKITASNTGEGLLSVVMSSSGDKPWVIPGPKEFNLSPRSLRDITAFVTPDCFAVPGKYSVSVTAKSGSESSTTKIGVDVSACVDLPASQEISLCRGETATSKISIRNIARDEARIYRITASSQTIPAAALSAPQKVEVGVNSQKDFEFSVDASGLDVGSYAFEIKAQALYEATDVPTTDVDTAAINVNVKNCESYEFQAPSVADVCAGVPTVFKAKLINKGAPAEVAVVSDASYITFQPSSGTLHQSEVADIDMTITAPKGEYAAKLTAKSDLKSVDRDLKIISRECFGVDMQISADKVICSEDGAEYGLKLTNRDTPAEYALSVSGIDAALSKDKITLGKSESQILKFVIPKDSDTGTFTATITAASSEGKDSITKELSVQKCFDFRLTGPEVELCPCEQADITFELINFGIKDDAYSLKSESNFLTLKQQSISVASKGKGALIATVNSCSLESGKYNGVIVAKSGAYPSGQDSLKIDLTVKSKEQCYGIELKSATDKIPSKCEIKGQAVQVTNLGTKETAVSLSATFGSKVTPDNLLLSPGDTKEVQLVVFPSPSKCGTTFDVDMMAEGKGTSASKRFTIEMEPEEKGAIPPVSVVSVSPKPSAGAGAKVLTAEVNYSEDTLVIKSLPDTKIIISREDGNITENMTDSEGTFMQDIGAGTFLITLSRSGYKPLTLAVNVTDGEGASGSAGNLGTIPLLLVAFLIIVAALYFVLRRGGEDSVNEDGEDEEAKEKPKRRRRRRR
ncbi:MAG: hypothetical protein ABH863_01145 [Candidatus Micrarchaeota archaeon]